MAIERVRLARSITLAAVAVAALLASAPRAVAEDKVSGTITIRSETTFTLMQADGSSVIVALDESTKVESGHSAADLMPGLRCEVTGTFDAEHQLVARKVTFSKESYRIANAINAGLTRTNAQVASKIGRASCRERV